MKSLIRHLFIISLLVFFTVSVVAQTPIPDTAAARKQQVDQWEQDTKTTQTPEKLRQLAMTYAVIAGLDDPSKETTEKAISMLEQASRVLPEDFELMAAHGSVLSMLARYETETAKQLHYVKKGFRMMDRAIKQDPNNIGALLQRANNSLNMPVFLKRAHFAQKDFQKVLEITGDSRGPVFKAMVLFNLGQADELLNNKEQARAHWKQAANLNAPYWSEKALSKLNF